MQHHFSAPIWVKGSNIYEVNIRQYTKEGTFNAFASALPRLHQMGVEILWFMPITPISKKMRLGTLGSYYATSNYTTINPEFGTLDDFKNLVNEAHKLGLKVIIDWVANHTGWDHHWTHDHPDFYKKNSNGNFYDAHGWVDVIDLDYSNNQLRNAMMEAMKYWLTECDIDGFRCDMAHLVPLDFWMETRTSLNQVKKDLFWLAETEDIKYHQAFDATYAWELLHMMEAINRGISHIPDLERVLQKYATRFPEHAIRLAFTSNHDENSHSGSEYERMGFYAKTFAILTATWKNCMPLVYSGQELPNKKRLLFFDKDEINWTATPALHHFYKTLLTLHRTNNALHAGNATGTIKRIKTTADDKIFAYTRQAGNDQVIVILNISPQHIKEVGIDNFCIHGKYRSAFSSVEYDLTGPQIFEMMPYDYLLYHRTSLQHNYLQKAAVSDTTMLL